MVIDTSMGSAVSSFEKPWDDDLLSHNQERIKVFMSAT